MSSRWKINHKTLVTLLYTWKLGIENFLVEIGNCLQQILNIHFSITHNATLRSGTHTINRVPVYVCVVWNLCRQDLKQHADNPVEKKFGICYSTHSTKCSFYPESFIMIGALYHQNIRRGKWWLKSRFQQPRTCRHTRSVYIIDKSGTFLEWIDPTVSFQSKTKMPHNQCTDENGNGGGLACSGVPKSVFTPTYTKKEGLTVLNSFSRTNLKPAKVVPIWGGCA